MNKIFSIFRKDSGCRMNGGLKKRFEIFIISLLVLLTSSLQMSAQNDIKGPGHNPPGPMVQTIDIQVPMPVE